MRPQPQRRRVQPRIVLTALASNEGGPNIVRADVHAHTTPPVNFGGNFLRDVAKLKLSAVHLTLSQPQPAAQLPH